MPQLDDELKPFLQAYPDTSHVDVLIIDLLIRPACLNGFAR
jgi:hypothetical protein